MSRSLATIMIAVVTVLIVSVPAEAQTTHWSADIRVEEWVSDGGKPFYGYWRRVFGNIRGSREFEYDGVVYTVELFYITNEPRSLLVGLTAHGGVDVLLPDDSNLAFLVEGARFALSDVSRIAGDGVVAWDDSGLDWSNGQIVSVALIEGSTPVPALPLVGAGLLALLLGGGAYRRLAGGLVVLGARREQP